MYTSYDTNVFFSCFSYVQSVGRLTRVVCLETVVVAVVVVVGWIKKQTMALRAMVQAVAVPDDGTTTILPVRRNVKRLTATG